MLHVFLDGNAFPAFLCCLPLLLQGIAGKYQHKFPFGRLSGKVS